jgi:hypothetical protein
MDDTQYNTIEKAAYARWQTAAAPHERTYLLAVQKADSEFLRCKSPDCAAYNNAVQTAREIWKANTHEYWNEYAETEGAAWAQLVDKTDAWLFGRSGL